MPRDDHSSSPGLATGIQRPTRGFILPRNLHHAVGSASAFTNALSEPGQLSPPIWSCTSRGLPCPRCCHRGGGLLPHLFTLTGDRTIRDVPKVFLRAITGYVSQAVYSLWHCPWTVAQASACVPSPRHV